MLTFALIQLYIVGCLAIAVAGRHRTFGFWGYFFFSLLVTPVIGLLTIIGGAPRQKGG